MEANIMAGILTLCCFLVCGVAIALSLFRNVCTLAAVWLGLCLGLILMMWLPALFAFFCSFNMLAQCLAMTSATVVAVVCLIVFRTSPRKNDSFADGMPVWILIALVLPFTILAGYLQYTHTLRPADGALYVGQSTYGDLCLHLGFATSFQNASFPPDYSILRGTKVGYPFLSDSMVTTMLLMGADLAGSFIATGTLMMFLVFVGFVLLSWELTRNVFAVVLSFLLFFLNGGFGFLYVLDGVFKDSSALRQVFTGFYKTPTNMPELNLRWVNVICDMMIPQRTLLAGWTVLLPALYQLVRAVRSHHYRPWIVLGLWAGSMPMIHTHSFLALGLISLGVMACSCLRAGTQKKGERIFLRFAVYGSAALLLALPQLMIWTFPQTVGGGSLRFRFNWVNNAGDGNLIDGYFWFWLKNVGPVYLLAVPALLTCKKGSIQRALGLGALLLYAVAECIQFQPNPYDNNKLFYVAYMIILPMVGAYLVRLWSALAEIRGRALLAVVFLTVCFISGCMSLGREAISNYQLFGADENAAAVFIKDATPQHAQFLTGQQHNNAVAALTGRYIVCGTGSYLYYHGIDYSRQQADMRLMYEDPRNNETLFDEYGIEYIYISDHERNAFQIDQEYFEDEYELIYREGSVEIFRSS